MKKVPLKKIVAFVVVGLLLFISNGYAQIEKGVTSTGKEVDCSTINPSVDKTVNEHGKIVTHPRVTRNGKLITTECSTCGVGLSITDTVTCVSITLNAAITAGDPTAAVLKVYSDAAHNTQVGSDIAATVAGSKISAVADNLNCHTRYYFVLEVTDASGSCTFEWTDSTRDMTMEKVTTCTVGSVRALGVGTDLSHEHGYNGSTTEIDSVYDHEGNAYTVVQIGNQCWLKENMRCTTEPGDATNILQFPAQVNSNHAPKYAYYPNDNPDNYAKWGCLYNWPAAMNGSTTEGSRGICPEGWHVPTDGEWTTMLSLADVGVNVGVNAGKLAGGCDWGGDNPASTGPSNYSYSDRNSSGFSAFPVGVYNGGVFFNVGNNTDFWCSTPSESNTAYGVYLYCSNNFVYRATYDYIFGFSVRCVRNTPDTITFISNNVIDDTVKQAVDRGATVQLSANTFSRGVGFEFVNWNTERTGCGTAYADEADITVTGNITLYAQWKTFCTVVTRNDANELGRSENRIDTVKDHQGNKYTVMTINGICVMKQNMRCTTLPTSGHSLTEKSSNSTTQSYYKINDIFGDEGYLYNWHAALDKADGYEVNNISKVTPLYRGICPDGWHIPTEADWNAMKEGYDAGQLAASSCNNPIWNNSSVTNAPGNSSDLDKNLTGFSALPVGYHSSGSGLSYVNQIGYFITYAPCGKGDNAEYVYNYHIAYNKNTLFREKDFKRTKVSVRCMRNPQYAVNPVVDTLTCNTMNVSAQTIGLNTLTGGTINLYTNEDCTQGEIVGSTTVNQDNILATINGLSCNTRYYIKVTATDGSHSVEAVITDSTRDMTMEKVTTCTVGSVRALGIGTDLSHEHGYNGSTTEIDSVYDHEGNAYTVVQIGNQCWLKENMRCTTSPNGLLAQGNSGSMNTTPYYYCPSTNVTFSNGTIYTPDQFKEKFGLLYNFPGTMDINTSATSFSYPHRGICPEGWHVPTDAELITLADSAGVGTAESGTGLGKLAGGCDWNENNEKPTCPGNYSYVNRNESGFSAFPAGRVDGDGFHYSGNVCDIWSATPAGSDKAWWRSFYASSTYAMRSDHTRGNCVSVRCVRNAQAKNYCSVDLKLDNEEGSVDGRIDSVADHQGNWYKVVEIGNQCWLAENMRATTEPTDPTISIVYNSSVGSSSTEPRAFYYLNDEANYAKYGALYNFPATMNYTGDLPAFVHPHRGICPEGWHVPEDAEWTTMEKTVASEATNLHNNFNADCLVNNSDFQASDTPLAVELSGGTDWQNSSNEKGPGYYYNTLRNITGFSALPAGDYRNNFYDINETTYFMSSTTWLRPGVNDNLVICRGLYYEYSGMNRNAYNIENQYSVRCVRDN